MPTEMNRELSERFLNAYCRLEDELRKITGSGTHESFTFLLDHAARSNAAFAQYKDDLKEYAELRNAIVHKRIADAPIAEPHPEVVLRIEKIADLITQAPKLEDFFRKHVEVCSPQDTVRHVLELLRKGRFNQLPVYNGKKLVGLLTSDAIVTWLAESFQDAEYVYPGVKVKELLHHFSGQDDFAVLSGKSSIFDAIDAFDRAYKRGKHLKAIIITENGNEDKHPIGIITTLEVPRLITLVNPEPTAPVNKNRRS